MELTKNEGVTYDQEAVWDIRSFCDVMTNFVKVEVETVYTVVNNGFKEIQFYHDNCLTGLFVCLLICFFPFGLFSFLVLVNYEESLFHLTDNINLSRF